MAGSYSPLTKPSLFGRLDFFGLDTRFLSVFAPDFFCVSSRTLPRKREYRILAAWPFVMGLRRTGSFATRSQLT